MRGGKDCGASGQAAGCHRPVEQERGEGADPVRPGDGGARVQVDGAALEGTGPVYLMLNKPAGLVSATEDPRQPTVLCLLPERYRRLGLFPAGRLDKDTEGLLLLTNDGPLAHRLLSPRYHVDKVYYLEVDGVLEPSDCRAVEQGMELADGTVCRPARLEVLAQQTERTQVRVTLREGKYHQVKRMIAAVGGTVVQLRRVQLGGLTLDPALPAGAFRELTEAELALLQQPGVQLG